MFGALAKDDFYALAPAFVNACEFPIDFGGEVAEQSVGCGMDVQGWRHQVQQGLFGGQLAGGEISEAGKFSTTVMPLDSRPVVEALEREVNVFVGLEFDDGEAAMMSAS